MLQWVDEGNAPMSMMESKECANKGNADVESEAGGQGRDGIKGTGGQCGQETQSRETRR